MPLPAWGQDNLKGCEPFTILYPTPEQAMRLGRMSMKASGDDEGPWAVYDAYCLKCSYRYVSVAPVAAEDVDLWECPQCHEMTVQWHAHPDWEAGDHAATK